MNVAFVCLHYGKPYLAEAIASVIDAVDRVLVIYSPVGSHGSHTDTPCPDTREELHALATMAAGNKLDWVDGRFAHEGQHRDAALRFIAPGDKLLVVDSDEIYADGLARDALAAADAIEARRIRLPFWHYWRSLKRGFMHDPAYPERIINTRYPGNAETLVLDSRVVHHMGYAQPSEYIEYKWRIHGHKAEFRRDCDWLRDVWHANRQYDCHPVGSEYWNAEDMPAAALPTPLRNHPYRELEVIP